MISISPEARAAINAAGRNFDVDVNIYFDGPGSAATSFHKGKVKQFYLLEELAAPPYRPWGSVSSNEITIYLDNSDRAFTATNAAGPYYGKLNTGVQVVVYIKVQKADLSWESILLGTFWSGDWNTAANSALASIVCYDRLSRVGRQELTPKPVFWTGGTHSPATIFALTFQAAGLVAGDYNIVGLTTASGEPYIIIPQGKLIAAANELSSNYDAYVYMSRDNKLTVKDALTPGASVISYGQGDQILRAYNPPQYSDVFSSVAYTGYDFAEGSTEELAKAVVSLVSGSVNWVNLTFNEPIARYDFLRILDASYDTFVSTALSAWGANLRVWHNNASPASNTLVLYGRKLVRTPIRTVLADSAIQTLIGDKPLELDRKLRGRPSSLTSLLAKVADPDRVVYMETKGDPTIELGDVVTITDTRDKLGTLDVQVIKNELTFTGALRGKQTCFRTA